MGSERQPASCACAECDAIGTVASPSESTAPTRMHRSILHALPAGALTVLPDFMSLPPFSPTFPGDFVPTAVKDNVARKELHVNGHEWRFGYDFVAKVNDKG